MSEGVRGRLAFLPSLACVLSLATLVACGPQSQRAQVAKTRVDGVSRCEYLVRAVSPSPLVLDVTASCRGQGVRGLEADEARTADAIGSVASHGVATTRRGSAFLLAQPEGSATFHYRVDLDRLAGPKPSIDRALRSGGSLLAPASSFLLYPLPLDVGIDIDVRVETPGMEFASGLSRVGDHFHLQAHEIPVATYSVFGSLQRRRIPIDGDPAELELAVLDGKLSVDLETLSAWVKERAQAVAKFYRGFPAPRALIVAVPVPEKREVVFGKLLPESAPGVVLLVGSDAAKSALDEDWVLVHELFHIGVPSFFRTGKWFDEGLATYFEPIIRVRAGLYDEQALWRDFAQEMPRALGALTRDGLEHPHDYTGIYWGGAIYCLLADVAARSASGGRLGLEDGVRRVEQAGGRAWEVWPLEKTLRTADTVFEHPVLAPLAARYAESPAPLDLEALLRSLGVERSASGVTLTDSAPLAWVRRAILTPTQG